jgi:hypothetical protein
MGYIQEETLLMKHDICEDFNTNGIIANLVHD